MISTLCEDDDDERWGDELPDTETDEGGGEPLNQELVRAARADEIKEMHARGVYERYSESEAREMGAKSFIGTRWVDRNKGSAQNPDMRCRLVAQEFAKSKRDDIFSPTLGLEAFRLPRLASHQKSLTTTLLSAIIAIKQSHDDHRCPQSFSLRSGVS